MRRSLLNRSVRDEEAPEEEWTLDLKSSWRSLFFPGYVEATVCDCSVCALSVLLLSAGASASSFLRGHDYRFSSVSRSAMPCPLAPLQLKNTAQTASFTVYPQTMKTEGGWVGGLGVRGCSCCLRGL